MKRIDLIPIAPKVAKLLGVARCVIGLTALVSPPIAANPWLGRDESRRFSIRVFGRVLGGRDIALGAAALVASSDQELARLCALGAMADGIDCLATMRDFGRLPRIGRWLVLGSTLAAATCGAATAALMSDRTRSVNPGVVAPA